MLVATRYAAERKKKKAREKKEKERNKSLIRTTTHLRRVIRSIFFYNLSAFSAFQKNHRNQAWIYMRQCLTSLG